MMGDTTMRTAILRALLVIVTSATIASAAPSLQERVTALGQQLQLRYADNAVRRIDQRRRVEAVLAEWNAVAEPTERDRQRMAQWLDGALIATMPGRSGRLPATPRFDGLRRPESPATATPYSVSKPTNGPAATPVRSEWSRHPTAAPLEWTDPFVDDPAESPAQGETLEAIDLGAGRQSVLKPVVADAPAVSVDFAKLAARVRGYNRQLSDVSRRLTRAESVDAEGLASLAKTLETLVAEEYVLKLYRDGLSEEQRRVLPAPPSAEIARELLRREADALLSELPGNRVAERATLERVRDSVASL